MFNLTKDIQVKHLNDSEQYGEEFEGMEEFLNDMYGETTLTNAVPAEIIYNNVAFPIYHFTKDVHLDSRLSPGTKITLTGDNATILITNLFLSVYLTSDSAKSLAKNPKITTLKQLRSKLTQLVTGKKTILGFSYKQITFILLGLLVSLMLNL